MPHRLLKTLQPAVAAQPPVPAQRQPQLQLEASEASCGGLQALAAGCVARSTHVSRLLGCRRCEWLAAAGSRGAAAGGWCSRPACALKVLRCTWR
jgi:hypothetical protein